MRKIYLSLFLIIFLASPAYADNCLASSSRFAAKPNTRPRGGEDLVVIRRASRNNKKNIPILVCAANKEFIADYVLYDKRNKAFIVYLRDGTILRVSEEGIVTVEGENGNSFSLGLPPPTFIEEGERFGEKMPFLRGGLTEALEMSLIKLLHPELELFYLRRFPAFKETATLYPVFEADQNKVTSQELSDASRRCDGVAFDRRRKCYGFVEAGLHTVRQLKEKFVASYVMIMLPHAGMSGAIGPELTFFVSGLCLDEGRERLRVREQEALDLYAEMIKGWRRDVLRAGLSVPKRIIVEDRGLNRRFAFDISQPEVEFDSVSRLFETRELEPSLGHLLEYAYRLRTAA